MKRILQIFSVIIFGMLPLHSQNVDIPDANFLNAQEPNEYKPYYIGVSVFTSLLWFPTNLSFDYLKYNGKAYNGITAGYTKLLSGLGYGGGGAHLTYTRLAPKSRGYFETKFGIVFSNEFDNAWLDTYFLPVISIGYRHQKPNGRFFFRWAVSTGLIGAGFGVNLY
ncbi:MAG TPA: hypothetical protein ENO18_03635 [Caldithrix sp.]|nr:hypothetical protein [Caldithrix sp.]